MIIGIFKFGELLETPQSLFDYSKSRNGNCECFKNKQDWAISSQVPEMAF